MVTVPLFLFTSTHMSSFLLSLIDDRPLIQSGVPSFLYTHIHHHRQTVITNTFCSYINVTLVNIQVLLFMAHFVSYIYCGTPRYFLLKNRVSDGYSFQAFSKCILCIERLKKRFCNSEPNHWVVVVSL